MSDDSEPKRPSLPKPKAAAFSLPRYMPAVDGLRAFAVLAVLVVHFPWLYGPHHALLDRLHLQPVTQFGWMGVDLFFVISGFLITGILIDSKDSVHYFRNFYARRGLRIYPLYYAVLCFVLLLFPLMDPRGSAGQHITGWPYYAFYVQNFGFADRGTALLGVTWSLAVEEQFYISWPFIVLLCSRKQLRSCVISLLVLSPIVRWLVIHHYLGGYHAVLTSFGRMDGILAGSLLALWFRAEAKPTLSQLRSVALVLVSVGAVGSAFFLERSPIAGQRSSLVYTFLAMLFSGIVCFAVVEPILPKSIRWLLTNPVVSYIGRISYGIYLLHPIVYYAYQHAVDKLSLPLRQDTFLQDAVAFVSEISLAIIFASASWYIYEQPILRLKKRFARGTAGAASAGAFHDVDASSPRTECAG